MTRLSININTATEATLLARHAELGITVTEQVRRAVALLNVLDAATRNGERIRLVNGCEVRELVMFGTEGS